MYQQILQKVRNKGFTLIEIVIGTAIFLTVAIAAYQTFTSLFRMANANQSRIIAVELADEQYEMIRNMPYSNIGIVSGIPNGTLPSNVNVLRGGVTFNVDYTIRDVDLPFDGQMGSTTFNDLSPADEKFVQIEITCATCQGFQPVVVSGQIAPKNLESASTNGALFISAIDADGDPVPDADVHVAYTATTSPIIIDDTTNNSGVLQIVDVPPAVKAYNITVSKNGYSTDKTYPASSTNPTPVKQPATVAIQTLTQANFAIDKVSKVNFQSVSPTCTVIPNYDFNLIGAKTIGVGLPKYSRAVATGGSGSLSLNNMEWDSYTISPNDTVYDLAGINPLNPVAVNPDSTQNVQLVVVSKDGLGLLVTVKDSTTGLPVSNAQVHLTGPNGYDETEYTGQGYMTQTDWTGGATQPGLFSDPTSYASANGNIDTSTSSGNIQMKSIFGSYATNATGTLDSSIFDTGTTSNFYTISWDPGSQSPLAGSQSVKLQFAGSVQASPASWNFLGPDGTTGSYFVTPNSSISSAINGSEYVRYRAFLTTKTATVTPTVSDVYFTYTSGCIPPGQVFFQELANNKTYNLTVSKAGYSTNSSAVSTASGAWQEKQVILAP